jgi:GGDEF domain-containing protein
MESWSRPARPVADAPAADGDALAKAWLVALVARAPLADAAAIPVPTLAAEAPALCDALLAALRDDRALARLEPGGDLATLAGRAGTLAGAIDAAAAVAAVDVLRTVAWGTLRRAAGADPDPRMVADLAERLAAVTAVVAAASVAAPTPSFTLGDDLDDLDEPLGDDELAPVVVLDARAPEREPWRRALDFALARHQSRGEPFAVLLVDLDEVDRLVAAGVGEELDAELDAVERALRRRLAHGEALVRERAGRWWVVAAGVERAAAGELAHQLAAGVEGSGRLHGAPLTASIGLAVCPGDAADALGLAARADTSMFAARAAGVPLA